MKLNLLLLLLVLSISNIANAARITYDPGTPGSNSYNGFANGTYRQDLNLNATDGSHRIMQDYAPANISWAGRAFYNLKDQIAGNNGYINTKFTTVTPDSYYRITIICQNGAQQEYFWNSDQLNTTNTYTIMPPRSCGPAK